MSGVGVTVRQLRKVYGEGARAVHSLEAVDLRVPAGRFASIVGPSGSGKTTLLRILAGLETASGGTMTWDFAGRDRPRTQAPQVAMVFQDHSVFPWLTVRDNIGYGLWVRRVPRRERADRVAYWLERTGLREFADRYPHELSGGMRQRVGVARAFALDPDVLLMDEPFSALDAQTRMVLQEELLRLWQDTGKTVLFVTHSIDEALLLSDVIFVLSRRPGRILATLDVDLPRPRGIASLKRDERYGQLYETIWLQLQEQNALSPSVMA